MVGPCARFTPVFFVPWTGPFFVKFFVIPYRVAFTGLFDGGGLEERCDAFANGTFIPLGKALGRGRAGSRGTLGRFLQFY